MTTCASGVEVEIFDRWTACGRQADLVLPPWWDGVPDRKQEAIIARVKQFGGMLIPAPSEQNKEDTRLITMIRAADFRIVIEIGHDHPILDPRFLDIAGARMAALQWAIQQPVNAGCRFLFDSGRAFPLYPARLTADLDHFISLDYSSKRYPRQGTLGI